MGVLDKINSPTDIKNLDVKELKELAREIRGQIIETTQKNGGHLSSNLGVVETTLALYYTFDFPTDKIIFDVGHQCYAHKILSGRKNEFSSIRSKGGLSGFPNKEESEFDLFTVGHAGTSMAMSLGLCTARDKNGQNYSVVNIVGDGSLVNGLNLEALSSSNKKPLNYIVVLNDNGMSISKNKNGFYQFVSKGTTKRSYLGSKRFLQKIFGNSFITRGLSAFRNFVKRIINKNNYFENHGFKYVGVVDGNDIKELVKIMARVKEVAKNKAVLVHVKTTKGKGFDRAEERSDVYHGVGENLVSESGTFSVALGNKLNKIIEKDKSVMAITAGMKDGTGLISVEKENPLNFTDVGIAEEYAVTLASGMATGGLKPFVCVYSTFMQRAYDQIVHDVCLQNLPVIFCLDRAGLVGKDGKTHQGTFDLSYLLHVPNLSVFAPNTVDELDDIIDYALTLNSPVAIRYPKNATSEENFLSVSTSPFKKIKDGNKVTLLAVGPQMLNLARSCLLDGVGLYSVRQLKPLDKAVLDEIKDTTVITLEENNVIGGFGSLVSLYYREKGYSTNVRCLGIDDCFVAHGAIDDQLKNNGLEKENLLNLIKKYL